MDHSYFLQFLLLFILLFALTSGRALFYDELISDIDSDSDESDDTQESQLEVSDTENDISSEENDLKQRSIIKTSHSSKDRQHVIDLLRQAYNQGWKPNLKHYIPATRFGRHR